MVSLVVTTGDPVGLLTGDVLFGAGTADIWGHAWGYFRVTEGLGIWQPLTAWPEGQGWWVIDLPVALLLAPVTWVTSAGVSYNLAFLLHVAIGAGTVAAWLRPRVAAGHALVAGVLVATSPFVRGAIVSGVPEALSVLLLPGFAWLLWRGLRGNDRALGGAAVAGALVVLDGAYGAIGGAVVGAVVTGWGWERQPRRLVRAGLVAAVALLAVGGVQAALIESNHPALGTEHVDGRSIDVLSFVLAEATGGTGRHAHVVFVGFSLLLGAAASVRRVRAAPALTVAAAAALLALGPVLVVGGTELAPLPGALLGRTGASNLYRLAGILPVALIPLVALAAGQRRVWWGLWLAIAVEWTVLSPVPLVLPTTPEPSGPVESWLADHPDPGAVLDLPLDLEGGPALGAWPQRTFYFQTVHERPIASALYSESPVLYQARPLSILQRVVARGWTSARPEPLDVAPSERPPPLNLVPPLSDSQSETIEVFLSDVGFQFVSLDLELVEPSQREEIEDWVSAWLGPPDVADGLRQAWRLPLTTTRTDPAKPSGPRHPSPESSPSHQRR